MWWLIPLLLAAPPAQAQRPRCDYGSGLAGLREARESFSRPLEGLMEGRERGLAIATTLRAAQGIFTGCGCPRLAELTGEAIGPAERAGNEANAAAIARAFENGRFRLGLAEEAAGRNGCR